VRSFIGVARAVAWRNVRASIANPPLLIPPIAAPLMFFVTFVGAFSTLGRAPGFEFPSGYTSFQFVFIVLQAGAFNGVFMGFSIARDWESGFAQRLFLAAPQRRAILFGYVLAALLRTVVTLAVLFAAGFIARMEVDGSPLEMAGLVLIPLGVAAIGALWGAGVSFRARTIQAGPAMQMPLFLSLFLAPVFVPAALLSGWIKAVSSYNPMTVFLEAGRAYISGTDANDLLLVGVSLGMVLVLMVWGLRGLRSAERAT